MPERRVPVACAALSVVLVGCVVGVPNAPASSSQTAATSTPTPSDSASPGTSASPGASSTPSPSPTPDPNALELEAIGCPGGVVLDWSPSANPQFHHYTALRSRDEDIAPDYPPIAPAVDWGDTYATDPFVTSAVDASITPSNQRWNYRVMAYARDGSVLSASPVRAARLSDVQDLGRLRVSTADDGGTRLEWRPFSGFSGCFSSYRILFGSGSTPSTELRVISDQDAASAETDALQSGSTYQLRVEAVRVTTLGSFIAGETSVATYTVP
ncbi:MAG TPA: hypothetical protein VFW95_09620 [Candidatus Limnocylindria bacterium]|nr:hypothetical protein [Candidatus Limnocylindria bacterium]